jgi:hypothetical protein
MSFADMASDAYVVRLYFSLGQTSAAYSLLAMVGLNMLWQGSIVYMQTNGLKRDKWRTRLIELLAVVTFTKPGLDAYRVAGGAEAAPGAALSPLTEMSLTKAGELIFEAIPGLVLQLISLMKTKDVSTAAVASVFMSVASAGLTATTQFYDNETGESKSGMNKTSQQTHPLFFRAQILG